MTSQGFDTRQCELGEGPLWHPERKQLFWFDILGKSLLSNDGGKHRKWQFDEHVSAAGWIDHDTLLVASETGLFRFDIESGARDLIVSLEADNAVTRSNDGRADPWGGFWIGTMGKAGEFEAGSIYRLFKGKLERLFENITTSNAICFAPNRQSAYFVDTPTRQIQRQALDGDGWPKGSPEVFVDLSDKGLNPDGAVIDAEGCLWNAQWGASRVARYAPDGSFLSAIEFPASHISCPAFGGSDLTTLYATSALEGIDRPGPNEGRTFATETSVHGLPEYKVIP